MNKKALTLTVVANMTSNYSEGLGNVASVQKVNILMRQSRLSSLD